MKQSRIMLVFVLVALLSACRKPVQEIAIKDASVVSDAQPIAVSTADWPWWRGPTLDGKARGEPPPVSWSEDKNVIWRVDVPGRGHASPSVCGDRVFVPTADEAQQTQSLLCYNRADGQLLWDRVVHRGGFMHTHAKNSHASATPACDGERAFMAFMVQDGIWVTAVDRDGEIVWQTQAGPFKSQHGFGSSPVLYKSLVIVAGDNSASGFLAALDRGTGDIVWRVRRQNKPSYATPIIADVAGHTQLLLSGQDSIVSYNPDNGQVLWTSDGPASTTANTMVWNEQLVFASGGYPQNNVMAIRADGSAEVVWQKRIKDYVPSLLLVEDRLYVIQDDGILRCLKADSGDQLWTKRLGGNFSASPVLAGGNIYVPNEQGTTFVFSSRPEFELIAENDLADGGFASPVIVGGKIFLRTNHRLYCIGQDGTE